MAPFALEGYGPPSRAGDGPRGARLRVAQTRAIDEPRPAPARTARSFLAVELVADPGIDGDGRRHSEGARGQRNHLIDLGAGDARGPGLANRGVNRALAQAAQRNAELDQALRALVERAFLLGAAHRLPRTSKLGIFLDEGTIGGGRSARTIVGLGHGLLPRSVRSCVSAPQRQQSSRPPTTSRRGTKYTPAVACSFVTSLI